MKQVLLLIHNDAGQEARLQTALDLTRALSGHLHCLDVTPEIRVFDTGLAPPVILDEADREEANKARVQQRLADENVSWSWADVQGDFAVCLLEAARNADVIVLNRRLHAATPDMAKIASRVLVHADALVVVVGERARGLDPGAPALIAWDGSENALRALERAAPVLAGAGKVTIFQAGALPRGALPASEAVSRLADHGIAAEIEVGPDSDDPACEICAAAKRMQAGYCVMGAFGHSRLREALLGGVSRRMLDVATVPLLMTH